MTRLPFLVRSASLSGYEDLAISVGLDPMALLRKVNLPRHCLSDTESPISMEAVCRLLEISAEISGVEDFGLRLSAHRKLSNLGPLSLLLRQEPTGLAALTMLSRYLQLLNASLLMRIAREDGVVVISEELLLGVQVARRQAMELTVGVMFQILRSLLGPTWKPRSVRFAHGAPSDSRIHRTYFGASVEFNAQFNGIVCLESDLNRRLPDEDPALAKFAQRILDDAMVKSKVSSADTVRHMIAALLPGKRCTIDRVGQHLGISRRTIHRRLLLEGETFASLLNGVRREFVLRQMRESDIPLLEVAQMLGFSSASSFAHWFKEEFGTSFVRWRRAGSAVLKE